MEERRCLMLSSSVVKAFIRSIYGSKVMEFLAILKHTLTISVYINQVNNILVKFGPLDSDGALRPAVPVWRQCSTSNILG